MELTKERVMAAVASARAGGWEVVPGLTLLVAGGDGTRRCCPLGAVAIAEGAFLAVAKISGNTATSGLERVAEVVGISLQDARRFARGFDEEAGGLFSGPLAASLRGGDAYSLGRLVCREMRTGAAG